jgi:hypothetical protein
MKIIPVLAVSANDAPQAEALLDYLALVHQRIPTGHLVLAFAPDLHGEYQTKLRIAAEIGFETVDTITVGWPAENAPTGKVEGVNHFFQKVAQHMARHYRLPFLWFEPDCVLTNPLGLNQIAEAYEAQPKLYLGTILADAKDRKCFARVGVYPRGAAQDLHPFFAQKMPFEIAAGEPLVARAGKTRLIQMLPILMPEDLTKVRADAVLVHGDKAGILLQSLVDKLKYVPMGPVVTLEQSILNQNRVTPKLDGRSKAARAAKMALV